MDNRDQTTKTFFDPKTVKFENNGITQFKTLELTDEFVIGITGAPANSRITAEIESDESAEVLTLKISNDLFDEDAIRYIQLLDSGFQLINYNLSIRQKQSGLGSRIFAHQVAAARKYNFHEMLVVSGVSGDDNLNGNYTWAILGCDAPLQGTFLRKQIDSPPVTFERVQALLKDYSIRSSQLFKSDIEKKRGFLESWPATLSQADNYLDFVANKTLQIWFKQNPFPINIQLQFDLAPISRSSKVHEAYLIKKDIRIA